MSHNRQQSYDFRGGGGQLEYRYHARETIGGGDGQNVFRGGGGGLSGVDKFTLKSVKIDILNRKGIEPAPGCNTSFKPEFDLKNPRHFKLHRTEKEGTRAMFRKAQVPFKMPSDTMRLTIKNRNPEHLRDTDRQLINIADDFIKEVKEKRERSARHIDVQATPMFSRHSHHQLSQSGQEAVKTGFRAAQSVADYPASNSHFAVSRPDATQLLAGQSQRTGVPQSQLSSQILSAHSIPSNRHSASFNPFSIPPPQVAEKKLERERNPERTASSGTKYTRERFSAELPEILVSSRSPRSPSPRRLPRGESPSLSPKRKSPSPGPSVRRQSTRRSRSVSPRRFGMSRKPMNESYELPKQPGFRFTDASDQKTERFRSRSPSRHADNRSERSRSPRSSGGYSPRHTNKSMPSYEQRYTILDEWKEADEIRSRKDNVKDVSDDEIVDLPSAREMTSRGSNASSRRRDSDLEIRRNKEKLQKAIEDAELRTKHLEQEIKRQEAELDRSPVGNDNDNESVQQKVSVTLPMSRFRPTSDDSRLEWDMVKVKPGKFGRIMLQGTTRYINYLDLKDFFSRFGQLKQIYLPGAKKKIRHSHNIGYISYRDLAVNRKVLEKTAYRITPQPRSNDAAPEYTAGFDAEIPLYDENAADLNVNQETGDDFDEDLSDQDPVIQEEVDPGDDYEEEEDYGADFDYNEDDVDSAGVSGKVYVGDLSSETTEQDLCDYFSRYGELIHWGIKDSSMTKSGRLKPSRRANKFGFIHFRDPLNFHKVMEDRPHIINNKLVKTRPVKMKTLRKFSLRRQKQIDKANKESQDQDMASEEEQKDDEDEDAGPADAEYGEFVNDGGEDHDDDVYENEDHDDDVGYEENETDPNKIFVRGLPPLTTKKQLRKYFSRYGKTVHAEIFLKQNAKRAHGVVTFNSMEGGAAVEAVLAETDHNLLGVNIRPAPFRTGPDPAGDKARRRGQRKENEPSKLFVKNLSLDTTNESLHEFFSRFGKLTDCFVVEHKETRESRGFGFITFRNPNVTGRVKGIHSLDGKKVVVTRVLAKK